MKQKMIEKIEIPSGISCEVEGRKIICKKDSNSLSRVIDDPSLNLSVKGTEVFIECEKGNKNQRKFIKSLSAHIKNMFQGLNEKFVYNLESCNVHFPMTLKIESDKLIINNFLGEKTPRSAKIVTGSHVELKGAKITVSSHDREIAGQTAANMEKATKVRNRDRRIFQDGIYIVSKPGRTA